MSKMREIAWPDEFCDLKRMEEFMVCGICYEVMETSVMTPCSHNYCSVCIRKYLHYKTQCPACFQNLFEKDLYINRAMDGLVEQYTLVREKLLTLIQNRVVYNTVVQERDNTPSTPPTRPARNNQTPRTPKVSDVKSSEPKTPTIHSPVTNNSKLGHSSPSTISSPKVIPSIAKIFNTTPKRRETVTADVNVKTVQCPVCRVGIPESKVNVHLDACLKREVEEKKVQQKPKVQKRNPLPKLVLRVMKDAELKKKMKELGLPTQGDRRTLESRFHRYSVIYNAECDKLTPRPVPDLIRQCEMEEKQERKMDSFLVAAAPVQRLQVERNASDEKNEEARKAYSLANKSSFEKLIEEVRNRRNKEKEKSLDAANPTTKTSNDGNTDCPLKDSEKNAETLIPPSEVTFEDSDSDEVCPLQHYQKDEQTNFCSVNLNESNSCSSAASSPVKKSFNATSTLVTIEESVGAINTSPNPYELSTDELSGDDLSNSPVIKGKTSQPKRVQLSENFSIPESSTAASSGTGERIETNSQEAAKILCNSIIRDFSCDASDDSSNGSAGKPLIRNPDEVMSTNDGGVETDGNLVLSKTDYQLVHSSNADVKNQQPSLIHTGMTESFEDFASDILNGDTSDGFANLPVSDSTVQEHEVPGEIKLVKPDDVETGKENDAFSANENSLSSLGDDTVRRPVRKRNRPSRYAEEQSSSQNSSEKIIDYDPDEITEASDTVSDGSLKRRRGRTKNSESQNPPKRPVRRRQPILENNQNS
ncbi:hypothetical protein QAD02_010427 [Eretmocerus hayati]|uniref:Uncharacterized protein n=1 Tax=Eretmocerus hayati TaxID=131215 RepID=A0ACC2NV03_9HYME|nr:hypothetical protein QAD02_010427 [Eretmocerus hayati]